MISRTFGVALSLSLAAGALVACSGDDSNGSPADGGAPDAAAPSDAHVDGANDATVGASPDASNDAGADAPGDAPATQGDDAPSDAPGDSPNDAGEDAGDAAPLYGAKVASSVFVGNDDVFLSLRGPFGGRLVYRWSDLVTGLSQYGSVSVVDGTHTALGPLLPSTDAASLSATNGTLLLYTAQGALWSVPIDGSAAPISLGASLASCRAIAADATYAYCFDISTPGAITVVSRLALASDAGVPETIALVPGNYRPEEIVSAGGSLTLAGTTTEGDGGAGYVIASIPASGLPDGGAATTIASGDGVPYALTVAGTTACWARSVAGSDAVTCASTASAFSATDAIALGATTVGEIATDGSQLWLVYGEALERATLPSGPPVVLSGALSGGSPTIGLDALHVYWGGTDGAIYAASR